MTSSVLVYNVQHGIREDHLQVKDKLFSNNHCDFSFAAPATFHWVWQDGSQANWDQAFSEAPVPGTYQGKSSTIPFLLFLLLSNHLCCSQKLFSYDLRYLFNNFYVKTFSKGPRLALSPRCTVWWRRRWSCPSTSSCLRRGPTSRGPH